MKFRVLITALLFFFAVVMYISCLIDSNKENFLPETEIDTTHKSETSHSKAETDLNPMQETASGGVLIRVEGYGETIKEAKQDAMRTAVEQVVGMLVDAQTRIECDEVIEKILTTTGAYVESNKVLETRIKDGVCTVQLEAVVVKNAISNKLRSVSSGASMKIDGSAIFDKMESKVQSEKDGVMFLANFLKEEQFPYGLLDVSFDDEPKIEQKSGNYTYTVGWTVKVNMERYNEFIKKLTTILDKVALEKSMFQLDLKKDSNGVLTYNSNMIPKNEGKNFCLRVCTNLIGSTNKQARFVQYILPQKFKFLLMAYGRVLPAVEINLLDSGKGFVASQIHMLQDNYGNSGYYYLFNLSNAVLEDTIDLYNRETSKGDSTLARIISGYTMKEPRTIAPFEVIGGSTKAIYESKHYNTVFTFSSEDMKKVTSAEIHVISSNPEMDKIYDKLESEIDNITTK